MPTFFLMSATVFISNTFFYPVLFFIFPQQCKLGGRFRRKPAAGVGYVWMTQVTPAAIQMRVTDRVSGLSLHELQPAIKKE